MTYPSAKLGDVAVFIRGITFKPDDLVPLDADDAVVCMRTKNVQALLDCSDLLAVPSQFVRRKDQYLGEGDILVSSANSWNLVGKCCWIPHLPWRTAFGGFVSVLRGDSARVERRYLYWWFASERIQELLRSFGQKTTNISNLNFERCLQLDLPAPPLPEQRRIAAILDKADALRTKRREALAELARLEQSIVESFLLDSTSTGIQLKLGDVAEKNRGSFVNGPFGSDLLTSELQEEGVPVVYIRDIRDAEYVRVSKVCVTSTKAAELSVCKVSPGDVLVAKVGDPPGVSAIYPNGEPTAIVTQDVIRIRCDKSLVLPQYICAYLNSSRGKLKIDGITVQATRARVSLGDFKKLVIDIPPLEEQRRLVGQLAALHRLRDSFRESARRLNDLFVSLQAQAFRGEL